MSPCPNPKVKSQWSIMLNISLQNTLREKIFVGTENPDRVCVWYLCVPEKKNWVCRLPCFSLFFKHIYPAFPTVLPARCWHVNSGFRNEKTNVIQTNLAQQGSLKWSQSQKWLLTQRSKQPTTICCRAAQGASLARHLTSISGIGIVSITRPFTSQLTHARKLAPCLVHNLR